MISQIAWFLYKVESIFHNLGPKSFFVLQISVARICRFFWWILTDLSLLSRSSKEINVSFLQTSLKALSWILLIRLLRVLPWNLSIFEILVFVMQISTGKLELARRWHFPAFATNWFEENQEKSFYEAACRFVGTCSIFEEYV